jgi:hypothetical protein
VRRAVRAAAAALILATSAPAAAQESLEAVEARIEAAIEVARGGLDDPAPERMDEVRAAVGLPADVDVAGLTIAIPSDPFLDRLEGSRPQDFRDALSRLEALREGVQATSDASPPPEPDLRRDMEEAYEGLGRTEPGLLQRLQRQVATFLGAAQRRTIEALRGGPAWIVLVLAVVLAGVALWRLRLRPVPQARAPRGRRPSAAEWRRRAEEARRMGDAAAAVVALYRSLVAELAERGLVEDRPSLTAGEVRAAVGTSAAGLGTAMADATRRYERVRYGMRPPTDEDVAALAEAERRARSAWAG